MTYLLARKYMTYFVSDVDMRQRCLSRCGAASGVLWLVGCFNIMLHQHGAATTWRCFNMVLFLHDAVSKWRYTNMVLIQHGVTPTWC